jgi:hypothetical protein
LLGIELSVITASEKAELGNGGCIMTVIDVPGFGQCLTFAEVAA